MEQGLSLSCFSLMRVPLTIAFQDSPNFPKISISCLSSSALLAIYLMRWHFPANQDKTMCKPGLGSVANFKLKPIHDQNGAKPGLTQI